MRAPQETSHQLPTRRGSALCLYHIQGVFAPVQSVNEDMWPMPKGPDMLMDVLIGPHTKDLSHQTKCLGGCFGRNQVSANSGETHHQDTTETPILPSTFPPISSLPAPNLGEKWGQEEARRRPSPPPPEASRPAAAQTAWRRSLPLKASWSYLCYVRLSWAFHS